MMWAISPTMEANTAAVIQVMGKDAFIRMALREQELLVERAAEEERKGWTKQAEARFKRALAIDDELASVS